MKRESKVDGEGEPILRVTYAKFKEGEATVREAKVSSNYGRYFEIILEIILSQKYINVTLFPSDEINNVFTKMP